MARRSAKTMRTMPILLACGGIASLCLMDAIVKQMTQDNSVVMAAWLRYAFGGLTAIPLLLWLRRPLPPRSRWPVHILRGGMLALMGYLFFFAISVLPLAEVLTIAFVAPLMVPPLAALFLQERMKLGTAVAGAIGFLGVLVTLQGAEGSVAVAGPSRTLGIAAALGSAFLYAVQSVLLRAMAQRDDAVAITMLSTVIPCLLVFPFAFAFSPPPADGALPLGFAAGLTGTIGGLMLAAAYARAEAQLLIVFEYSGLVWAALLGWLMFDEVPRIQIFVGAAIIAGACIFATLHERQRPRLPQKGSAF